MPNFERPITSQEKPKEEIISSEKELLAEYAEVAQQALQDFLHLKPNERVLILADKKSDEEMKQVLQDGLRKANQEFELVVVNSQHKRKELQGWLNTYDVVIDIQQGDNKATRELYNEDIGESQKARMLALLDMGVDIFRQDGPLSVPLTELERRMGRMEAVVRGATGVKITSRYGTNLEIGLKPAGERPWCSVAGDIKESGDWDNWPGGEVFVVPDETKTNGVLFLPNLDSEMSPSQGADKLTRVEFRDGRVVSIQGGQEAEKMRQNLESDARLEHQDGGNPTGTYRIAEFSFGANEKARSRVADPDQPYNFPGVSTVEAEKRFGTCHLALGFNVLGEDGAEGKIDVSSHYDFILPRTGLTVAVFYNDRDWQNKENGRQVIADGGVNFY